MDSVKVALGNRWMTLKAAPQSAAVRKECRALVHMLVFEINANTLPGLFVIWIVFPSSTGLPPGVWAEGHYIM